MNYLVYTDGSCSVKDRTGGYAWLRVDEHGEERMGGGHSQDTTISRMELMAAISALTAILYEEGENTENTVVLIYSDSEYVVKGFMDKNRARLKNVDLWNVLENFASYFDLVHMDHVKGHAGHEDNEAVDKLAGEFRQAAVRDLSGNTFT